MKIFRDLTDASNKTLTLSLQKISLALFGLGLFTGFTIMMAGLSSKNNDPENTLILSGLAIFFLLLSVILYSFVRTRVVTEIEKRLSAGGKLQSSARRA